ncbi:hypothetical protein M1146_03790 [Patescibacteria group bacterium]|nr:hypothetical protein [Patescibacteria group bacterium]
MDYKQQVFEEAEADFEALEVDILVVVIEEVAVEYQKKVDYFVVVDKDSEFEAKVETLVALHKDYTVVVDQKEVVVADFEVRVVAVVVVEYQKQAYFVVDKVGLEVEVMVAISVAQRKDYTVVVDQKEVVAVLVAFEILVQVQVDKVDIDFEGKVETVVVVSVQIKVFEVDLRKGQGVEADMVALDQKQVDFVLEVVVDIGFEGRAVILVALFEDKGCRVDFEVVEEQRHFLEFLLEIKTYCHFDSEELAVRCCSSYCLEPVRIHKVVVVGLEIETKGVLLDIVPNDFEGMLKSLRKAS